tara:strand:- start:413 stop:739 length:327 start_codon:yes stop_codon:yes gene_type:complete
MNKITQTTEKLTESLLNCYDDALNEDIERIYNESKKHLQHLQLESYELENKLKTIKQEILSINNDNKKRISRVKIQHSKEKLDFQKNVVDMAKLHSREINNGTLYNKD